ncbi:MAG: hypothetical protein U1E53_21040 [Dongiaceae bacterium]
MARKSLMAGAAAGAGEPRLLLIGSAWIGDMVIAHSLIRLLRRCTRRRTSPWSRRRRRGRCSTSCPRSMPPSSWPRRTAGWRWRRAGGWRGGWPPAATSARWCCRARPRRR